MYSRRLRYIISTALLAVGFVALSQLIFTQPTYADAASDKKTCITLSEYTIVYDFDEAYDDIYGAAPFGAINADTYYINKTTIETVARCTGSKVCQSENSTLGITLTCDDGSPEEDTSDDSAFTMPESIPASANPLIKLMCSRYSGQMKTDCKALVASTYMYQCTADKLNLEKIDEWSDCIYKQLGFGKATLEKYYPDEKVYDAPKASKIKQSLLEGIEATKTESQKIARAACEKDGGTYNTETDECATGNLTSCAIDGIGWLICPVMSFMAEANEKAFGFLQSLLGIRPSLTTDEGTQKAWSTFRDLANVAFVIAFLVIIYSQITSVGVSNYGIKKLLPKIAIAAIMVNLSLFACQILVDISNIAGASLYSFISGLVDPLTGTEFKGDSAWSSIMDSVLKVGVGVLLVAMVVIAPTVLLALGLILLILVARQAFVLILIIISPLAFVAYLLPNTEGMFKKWWKALSATLLVYPIIAVVFGASTLASNILMGIASDEGNTAVGRMNDDNQMLAIVALAVMAIPLFAVPVILKSAMSGAGKIGATLSGLQDRANRRASGDAKDRASKELKSFRDNMGSKMLTGDSRRARTAAFLTGTRRRANREARYKDREALRNAAEETFLHTEGSKSAARKAGVIEAQETANLSKEIIQNQAKQRHLNNNHDLHGRATSTGLDLHNAEETHKNQVGAAHMANQDNFSQYDALNASRGVKQNAELETTRRFEGSAPGQALGVERQGLEDQVATQKAIQKQTYNQQQANQFATTGQSVVQQRKVAEGGAKNAEQINEFAYQDSTDGRTLAQDQKAIEGELSVVHDEQQRDFELSDIGRGITVSKDRVEKQTEAAKAKNKDVAIAKNENVRVAAAAAQATVATSEAAEKKLVEDLKSIEGAAAHPEYGVEATELRQADIELRATTQATAAATSVAAGEFADAVTDSAKKVDVIGFEGRDLSVEAGGIDKHGAAKALAAAKATVTQQTMKDIENIQSTMPFEVSSDPEELKRRFKDPAASLEEKVAILKAMYTNGSPGVKATRETLTDWTNDPAADPDEIQVIKEIMQSDQGFQRAGRDFEVWSNNEHSEDALDAAGNVIIDPATGKAKKAPHASFGDVTKDSGVWADISAQRFASMNKSSQKQAFAELDATDPTGALTESLIDRIYADSTARGQIKEEVLDRIKTSRTARGLPVDV